MSIRKNPETLVAVERLREVLSYDADTGIFRWRVTRGHVRAGLIAGTSTDRYIIIGVDGRDYRAHRLAWLYVHGRWPAVALDHKNRNKHDNRLDNLREANKSLNSINTGLRSTNTSGYRGASFAKRENKWVAQITVNGQNMNLGYFATAQEAGAAYDEAALLYFGEFANSAG
jgi:hypothetical protein